MIVIRCKVNRSITSLSYSRSPPPLRDRSWYRRWISRYHRFFFLSGHESYPSNRRARWCSRTSHRTFPAFASACFERIGSAILCWGLMTASSPLIWIIIEELNIVGMNQNCSFIDRDSPNLMGNLWNALFDVFTFGHFIGLFSMRSSWKIFKLLAFASLAFEGLEVALRNIINNFR